MADALTKEDARQLMGAWDEFKSTNDVRIAAAVKGVVDPLIDDKLVKLNEKLDSYEEKQTELVGAATAARQAQENYDELKTQLEALQIKANRPGGVGNDNAAQTRAEAKAFANTYLRGIVDAHLKGEMNLSAEQKTALDTVRAQYKALAIGDDTGGGYLAPVEFVAEIIKGVTLISRFRSLVRVRTTANKAQDIPKRTGQFAAVRSAELAARTETKGLAYGMVELTAPEMTAIVDISQANLEDSAFDLAAEVQMEATEQFAVLEGKEVCTGTGIDECEGILVNGDVAESLNGDAAALTPDGILGLSYDLKTDYSNKATWVMNRKTLGKIRVLKDGVGDYLWTPGLAGSHPNTIDGTPYMEMPDMPDIAANAWPIAIGDFMRGYTLLDRVAMTMLRDPYTQAGSGLVRFWFRRRGGGRVVLGEAIRKLKIA